MGEGGRKRAKVVPFRTAGRLDFFRGAGTGSRGTALFFTGQVHAGQRMQGVCGGYDALSFPLRRTRGHTAGILHSLGMIDTVF